jgi:hypothetical protein
LLLLPTLCFLLPFINVSYFLEEQQLAGTRVVHFIPSISTYTGSYTAPPKIVMRNSFSVWEKFQMVFGSGCLLFLLRLVLQYLSFIRVRKNARLLTRGEINIYEVDKSIIPFSFGNAIFINPDLHSEAELKEILRHELVHVKQRHTLDIIWTEILCIFNWYNPFAWLLRHAVRQNLEFIADTNVLESGVDKKQYQYLLLKVMGVPEFRLASPFNFSSLKKRIVMMNKNKSARSQWLKFLFILPLLAVLLVAFRKNAANDVLRSKPDNTITVSGLVVQKGTYEPLLGVTVEEQFSGKKINTDSRGYFTMDVTVAAVPLSAKLVYSKPGFAEAETIAFIDTNQAPRHMVEIVNLTSLDGNSRSLAYSAANNLTPAAVVSARPSYEEVAKLFQKRKEGWIAVEQFEEISRGSERPFWVVNGWSFVKAKAGSWASLDEVTDVVFVDGKRMSGEEVNKTIPRSSFKSVGAMEREAAKMKYGIDRPVLEIYINTKPDVDTVPSPSKALKPKKAGLPDDYKAFLKRNPAVQNLHWRNDSIFIKLKSGVIDRYASNKPGVEKLEKKYGPLPVPPPPPPPLEAVELEAPAEHS